MKYLLAVFFLLFTFSLCVFAQTNEKASLIVKYFAPLDSDKDEIVERFDFDKGKLVSRRVLLSLENEKDGRIIGRTQDRFINIFPNNKDGLKTETIKLFDLKTERFVDSSKLPVRKKEDLDPYILSSPDGKKGIVAKFGSTKFDKLIIRIEGQADLVINETFMTTDNGKSSIIPSVPVYWLDSENLLIQKENGKLVIITLDGRISPLPELSCSKNDYPSLRRTKIGNIIYECDAGEFKFDAANKRFDKIRRDLDYEFSDEYIEKQSIYYYRNQEIGRGGANELTTEGYLAVTDGKQGKYGFYDANDIDKLKVWDKYTRNWQTFKINGSHLDIMCWYIE